MTSSTLAAMKAKSSSFSKLLAEVEKIEQPESATKNYNDERLWKLTIDKAGNGAALIRFLDAPEGEDKYWINIFKHGFSYLNGQIQAQGAKGGKWYLENSLTSIGKQDYASEMNKIAWDSGDQDLARKRKRTLNYYSNILVINDPENPDNNGKVFLFKYGKSIMTMIMARTKTVEADPLDEDSEAVEGINPFCFWTGADFALRICRKDGWPSYINSEFKKPKPLFKGDDEKIEELWKKEYSLVELLDEKHFKSYDELKKRFLEVTSSVSVGTAETADVVKFVEEPDDDVPVFQQKAPKPKAVKPMPVAVDDDDDLSFFEKLAAGE